MSEEDNEDTGLAHLRQLVSELTEEDAVFFLSRSNADSTEEHDQYRVMMIDMDQEAMMNAAVVALTAVGQGIIRGKQEESEYNSEEALQTAAFFYGLQALSASTSKWARDIAEEAQKNEDQQEGPRHYKEDITDSAGTDDEQPRRRTSGGDPIH